MGFLTLEDVNTANLDYVNEYYVLDTSLISLQEFNTVLYDFNIVSHTISDDEHTFVVTVQNSLWCGKYAVVDSEEYTLSNGISFDGTDTITITTESESIKLFLYMCSYATSFEFVNCIYFPQSSSFELPLNEVGTSKTLSLFQAPAGTQSNSFTANSGVSTITVPDINLNQTSLYMLVNVIKSDLVFSLTDNVTVGVVNHVPLGVDTDYLPEGALVDTDLLDITVTYNGVDISVEYDSSVGDYCFDLDLTDKLNNKDIKLTVNVNEVDYVNAGTFEVTLGCSYPSVSDFAGLKSELVKGASIIELAGDISFDESLVISSDTHIIGDDYTVTFDYNSVYINDGVNLKVSNIKGTAIASCFIQNNNTKLILENSTFTNAKITDTHKGSIITANHEETTTEINNCTFTNCHHTIYHGGELTVKNSKALFNTWNNFIDTDYPAFATIYDGETSISDSVFDIDYAEYTEYMIENEIQTDLKFSISLIGIGEGAIFNGSYGNLLTANDCLPLTEYNNASHIYAGYYYTQISDYVILSPVLNQEANCACHNILGTDWVYKNNVQVNKADSDSVNNIRKITWE